MAVIVGNAYLLAGSWLNSMLFMLEIVLMFRYFQLPSRPLVHRIGVLAIGVLDTICTFAIWANIYIVVLMFPCQSEFIIPRSSLQILSVILITTYTTASIEQLFLCFLYFSLTKKRMITVFLVFCVAVHLGFSYASAILILVNNTPLGSSFLTSKMGAISCAVTDVMVAAALLFTFVRFQKTIVIRVSMQSLLRRLTVLVFASGVVVASTTLFVMIFLLQGVPAYSLFFYCQGRIYALTILCNFLVSMPGQPTRTHPRNAPGSVVTTVRFHGEYIDHTANGNYDHRRGSELSDMSIPVFAPTKVARSPALTSPQSRDTA
ncbi:hypothetical protein MVEN_00197500 [Mycena venus]|uniref:Uncharacterized protein n=1 Tax=Mycena venus TaxID=2733690 RepID=A0A8H7DE19_9AGAR|nr:hypothetical protein MVEN_00197500 [Mycena venus]